MKDYYQALLARDYRFDGKFFNDLSRKTSWVKREIEDLHREYLG